MLYNRIFNEVTRTWHLKRKHPEKQDTALFSCHDAVVAVGLYAHLSCVSESQGGRCTFFKVIKKQTTGLQKKWEIYPRRCEQTMGSQKQTWKNHPTIVEVTHTTYMCMGRYWTGSFTGVTRQQQMGISKVGCQDFQRNLSRLICHHWFHDLYILYPLWVG